MTETLKRNRRPTAPGVLLKELFLAPRGIIHKEFAADIEISEKQLSLIVNGRRMMPVVAGRIAKALNTTPRLWLNAQAAVDDWDVHQELKNWTPKITYRAPSTVLEEA